MIFTCTSGCIITSFNFKIHALPFCCCCSQYSSTHWRGAWLGGWLLAIHSATILRPVLRHITRLFSIYPPYALPEHLPRTPLLHLLLMDLPEISNTPQLHTASKPTSCQPARCCSPQLITLLSLSAEAVSTKSRTLSRQQSNVSPSNHN